MSISLRDVGEPYEESNPDLPGRSRPHCPLCYRPVVPPEGLEPPLFLIRSQVPSPLGDGGWSRGRDLNPRFPA